MKLTALALSLLCVFAVTACGGSDSNESESQAKSNSRPDSGGSSVSEEVPARSGDRETTHWTGGCPFHLRDVQAILGNEIVEVEPEQSSLTDDVAICKFEAPGYEEGEIRPSVSFFDMQWSLEELAAYCELAQGDPGEGGEATMRADWGEPACQIINDVGLGLAYLVVHNSTVGISVGAASPSDAESAVDQFVALVRSGS